MKKHKYGRRYYNSGVAIGLGTWGHFLVSKIISQNPPESNKSWLSEGLSHFFKKIIVNSDLLDVDLGNQYFFLFVNLFGAEMCLYRGTGTRVSLS